MAEANLVARFQSQLVSWAWSL